MSDDLTIKYGEILIQKYGHADNHDFWCVMVETGQRLIEYSKTKGPFTWTASILNGKSEFPHHKISMEVNRDLAKVLGFNFKIIRDSYWISRGVDFTEEGFPVLKTKQ